MSRLHPKRNAVLNAWAAGKQCIEIAAELDVTLPFAKSVVYRARADGDPRAVNHSLQRRDKAREDIQAAIIKMRGEYETWANIGKALGITTGAAESHGKRMGLVAKRENASEAIRYAIRARVLARYGIDMDERHRRVLEMYMSGITAAQIAERLSFSLGNVYHVLKQARDEGKITKRAPPPREPKIRKQEPAATAAPRRPIPGTMAAAIIGARMTTHRNGMTPEMVTARANACAHAQRVARLPRLADDEAQDLIARHLRERGATPCPPRYCATINGGTGA